MHRYLDVNPGQPVDIPCGQFTCEKFPAPFPPKIPLEHFTVKIPHMPAECCCPWACLLSLLTYCLRSCRSLSAVVLSSNCSAFTSIINTHVFVVDLCSVDTANLAKQHATRVQRFEQRMCAQLKERQKVFEAAFAEQMENYRALGRIPGKFFYLLLLPDKKHRLTSQFGYR